MAVAAHYRKKLEKDDLKRLSKEVAKKLVRGDYKSGRVRDPAAKISAKHEKTVKNYVKDFMDKAVKKKEEREKARAARGDAALDDDGTTPSTPQAEMDGALQPATEASPNDYSWELKRKREDDADDSPRNIRSRTDEPPAPPPPPPPADDMPMEMDESNLTPMDDGSMGSFTEGTPSNGKLPLRASGQPSPMQLATPPTNGSGESKSNGSSNLRQV